MFDKVIFSSYNEFVVRKFTRWPICGSIEMVGMTSLPAGQYCGSIEMVGSKV